MYLARYRSFLQGIVPLFGLQSFGVKSRSRKVQNSKPGLVELESRLAPAIDMAMVTIGNPNNAPDPATGHGSVSYEYRIGQFEVTLGQYCEFLNAVARGPEIYDLYNASMARIASSGGITQTYSNGFYSYSVTGPSGDAVPPGADSPTNRPIANVNWFNAARFANWMSNGQPVGECTAQTTEDGAYTLNKAISGNSAPRNPVNINTGSAPDFFIPNEEEWYKAAYYNPTLAGGQGGYSLYATGSNTAPSNQIADSGKPDAGNLVNYILDATGAYCVTQQPYLDFSQNYLTNVGAFPGSASFYGTFDQNGNLWEINQTVTGSSPNSVLRGGAWTSLASYLQSNYSLGYTNDTISSNGGFRIAGTSMPTDPVQVDMVTVGDPGNLSDPATGFGAVDYRFQIAKTHVTIGQYTAFLNAVAANDPNQLYNERMATDLNIAGIARQGEPGNYSYSVINPQGVQTIHATGPDRPITYVSWSDAARFANWMSNGQPSGPAGPTTTENGAYNLEGVLPGQAVTRNAINPNTGKAPDFFIPLQDEWYKAAFYSPQKSSSGPGYYLYATQSDTLPGNDINAVNSPNQLNYLNNQIELCITQQTDYLANQNYLTDVGVFSASASHYGTFDQNGNVYQWNDLDGSAGPSRGLRGGYWFAAGPSIIATGYAEVSPAREASDTGFRLAGGPLPNRREVPQAAGPLVAQPFDLAPGSMAVSLGNGKLGIRSSGGNYQEVVPFPGYAGPLNVSTLTRSGDTVPDSLIVAVSGPSSPHVLVIDSATGRVAMSFYAFDPKFHGGVSVTGGTTRLAGDWTTVILCGAGAGSEPAVSLFDAVTGDGQGAFYAFSPEYKGGVRVALSQPQAEGTSYAVVSSTINSHIVVYLPGVYSAPVYSYYALSDGVVPAGFNLAAADLDLDGELEIIAGVEIKGNTRQVAVLSLDGHLKKEFNLNFPGGARVAVNDANGDGVLDIVAASAPGVRATLSTYNYANLDLLDTVFISDSIQGIAAATNFARP